MIPAAQAANVIAHELEHETLDLVKAAKCVVALSGWSKTKDGREVFQSSYFAVEVLRKAIEQHENPVLRLAPEGIEPGRV